MTLTFDISAVSKDIEEKRSYHAGQLTYRDSESREYSFPVQIKTRGHFRRNPRVCDSPPLNIKFPAEAVKETLFRGQGKLKLVTHCRRKLKAFNDYVVQEYLIYRLYNILSEKSMRARLVQVTYQDSKKKARPLTRYGILLENDKMMATRLKVKNIQNKWGYHLLSRISNRVRLIHAIFQFLIGHVDWSVPGEHNVKLIEDPATQEVYPVPYDFDLCGLVNAHYAFADPKFEKRIKSVRERLYRGFFMPMTEFTPVFAYFKEKRAEIYALFNDFPFLKSSRKKSIRRYLDQFYEVLDKPRLVKRHFIDKARKTMR
jgi:hypothetical protein